MFKRTRMKIFISSGSWEGKVNFVDKNNVLVGYDTEQNCCESAGWYLSPVAEKDNDKAIVSGDDEGWTPDNDGLEFFSDWVFDTKFGYKDNEEECDDGNYEREAVFRMIKGDSEQFLHLYNVHNGYYSHGFVVEKDDKMIHEGDI